MHDDGIAIIGIGCRFPGGINDTESFWKLLVDGREAVCEVPADRWNVERFYDAEPGIPGKSIAKRGGFIEALDQFDPQFFGISPREAPYIDPQQRLLLETAWEALEDAGIVLDLEKGTDIAVFAGISHNDYQVIQGTPWDSSGITPHSPTGSAHSIAANRISYCLNLKGPSVAMDTACSSALTAVHAACEHIWTGRGTTALAGGVTVMITPSGFIGFSQASMLSPDGHCKAFAAEANGFVRGEGAGMVLLKRLSDALRDGDPIHGVIIGTATNQDGHTNGISLPSPEAQAQLVKDACRDAGIRPAEVGFVEAHGTGTAVGDPIEAHALADALCGERETPLPIGSVKTNLGHLETAAGVAGLVKAVLALKHGKIPASLHFQTPSPHINFPGLKLRVPTEIESFPEREGGPRIAGVNSFGFGGANAHVILTEPPKTRATENIEVQQREWPIVLSARSEDALRASAWKMSLWVQERLNANGHTPQLADLTYTLGARRNHHQHRLTLTVSTLQSLSGELDRFATGGTSECIRTSFTPRREKPARIGFVMSGQGPQWWGMGRELMKFEPVFREAFERCAEAIKPWAHFSLLEELARPEAESQLHRTEIAQPAIFAMQVALAELWKSWGVTPDAVTGHSVGEVAAAWLAGVLTLEQAAQVITLRSQFMESCARGEGAMLAVGLDEQQAREVIQRRDRTVDIAAFNGPRSLTLAGLRTSLEAIAAELEPTGVFVRFVRVAHPFHHPLMQPAADQLETALAHLQPNGETIPFFSTVTGTQISGLQCRADHWARGIRQPVQFVSAVNSMADSGVDVWLELGAHPALSLSIQECLGARGTKAPVFASARRENEHRSMLESALDLHRAEIALDFRNFTPSRKLLSLPAYAWDKSRWWSEAPDWRDGRLSVGGRGILDVRLSRALPTWVARLDNRHMAFLKDHKVENMIIFPAAAYVDMILEAGVQFFEGRPFVIEDFEIRKPLILPDPPAGLMLEVTYDPAERTFSIQSRFEQGAAWSVHVVGSMRSERTESSFASSTWESAQSLDPVEIEGFYNYMHDMGLKYGEEFRPLRELSARDGKSAGKVTLSANTAKRAAEYPLHPVLLDGALHVFSAGAATIEGRKSRLKLPVRFGRIHFVKTPGASGLVSAKVLHCSDEYLEGQLGIYDETGKPCVFIDGFRAIGVSGRKSGMPSGSRDLSYHLEWEKTPATQTPGPRPPLPLERLQAIASRALDQVIAIRGRETLQGTMAAEDDLAAVQISRGLREMGVNGTFTAESLGIAELMRPVFGRFTKNLSQRGLLQPQPDGSFRTTSKFDQAVEEAPGILRDFLAKHPGHHPEALLCAGNCAQLGAILRGEKDAVQVLFSGVGAELLDQFYGDGLFASHWMTAIAATISDAARHLPEGRGLRILEIGAGTGGLTAHLLPLLQRNLHRYVFTDVSAAFFSSANQKLAAFPEVEYQVFNLEKAGIEQGFESGMFDFVVGTNVLHAVSDVRKALRNIHELLTPGGTLFFMDVATPHLWIESVFGLTSGWWQLTDRDLRPEHPLLQRPQWETVLRESGFTETASIGGLTGPLGEGQIGLLGRKEWSTPVATSEELPAPTEKHWLIFADETGVGAHLRSTLQRLGAESRLIHRADRPFHWEELLCAQPIERIVYLWGLDEQDDRMGTDTLLHLAHALEKVMPAAKLKIDLITRGAQPIGHHSVAVKQAPAIGLFRVILNEYPNLTCRGIDLPPESSASDPALLWNELQRSEIEREVACRGEARYVQRISRGLPSREQWLDPSVSLRLEPRERGLLDTLRFVAFEPPTECGPDEALIEVKAAGMNFRDVLKALGLYPAETADARMFGDEVGGIVRAVGQNVTHLKPGDPVFGLAVFGLATHTVARATDLRLIPAGISFEEAATIPVVFMTAWHALNNVARMRKGETILVHAGAGGVGMAAIQIAQYLGVEVIATAGSPAKRTLLQTLGVRHVLDSRRADFAEAVLELTNRRGVDVVLNSLAGEAIPMGLACLAEFGRFIEIGKRDIYQNSRIPLWPLRKNASFHVVAMDAVFNGDAKLASNLLAEVTGLVEKGALRPLPFRAFPACRVDAAFRLMAQGKHTGKVIVIFAEPLIPRRGEPLARPFQVDPEGNYLITGAFGGFGKVLAEWLVGLGARHLTLNGRSGASTPEAEAFLQKLRGRGVSVQVVKGDAGNPEDIARLLKSVHAADRPLKGLFHLAMVIDDAPVTALTPERMDAVIAPKARGAWMLHEGTRDMNLDCFVLFSSVSSIFGNPAQGNYSAANAFLDALAHHRHALGLPALAVNWGVLGGQGYVARNEKVAEFLARQGTGALTPGEVTALLETYLSANVPQVAAIRVDWNKWRQFFRGMQENPLLERIFASGMEEQQSGGVSSDWRRKIEGANADERESLIAQALKEVVGSVLRVKPDGLRDEQPLTDLGMDSLMGVEVENLIESTIGVALPPASLMRARTIGQIATLINQHLGGSAPAPSPKPVAPQSPAPSADEVDIDALSEVDIEKILTEPEKADT